MCMCLSCVSYPLFFILISLQVSFLCSETPFTPILQLIACLRSVLSTLKPSSTTYTCYLFQRRLNPVPVTVHWTDADIPHWHLLTKIPLGSFLTYCICLYHFIFSADIWNLHCASLYVVSMVSLHLGSLGISKTSTGQIFTAGLYAENFFLYTIIDI